MTDLDDPLQNEDTAGDPDAIAETYFELEEPDEQLAQMAEEGGDQEFYLRLESIVEDLGEAGTDTEQIREIIDTLRSQYQNNRILLI